MGKGKLIIATIMILLLGMATDVSALPAVGTTTVSSGQVPTASNWNTYLNRAENWINTNLLNSGNTFTIVGGDSALFNGTVVVDSFRVTGFFDLATHIVPRATRTYRIGLPTRLVWGIHADTVRAAIADFDSMLGTTILGSTPIWRPSTDRTGVLGLPTFMWQSVHTDSLIGQNVTLDSLSVTSGIDSTSIDNGGVSGADLAATLSGAKTWPGYQAFRNRIAVYTASDSIIMYDNGGPEIRLTGTASDDYAGITINIPSSGTAESLLTLREGSGNGSANNKQYMFAYGTSNYLRLQTSDSDGLGTAEDVIRVPDGQLTVDGNSTFDDNAFDYICEKCGYHTMTVGECPVGHGKLVWHDDVASLREAIRNFKKNSNYVTSLEKLGVLKTYPDGQKFISMSKAPWVAFSAIVQQSDRITRENENLQAQIDELKRDRQDISVVGFILAGVGCGFVIVLFRSKTWRKRAALLMGAVLIVEMAHALTLEQKILIVFRTKGENNTMKSVKAITDSVRIVFSTTDSTVSGSDVQDAIRNLEYDKLLRHGNNKIFLMPSGIDSSLKLP